MERATRELVTEVSGHVVLIKTWLNNSEDRKLNKFWANRAKITLADGKEMSDIQEEDVKVNFETNDPTIIYEYHDLLAEVYVLSVDGEPYTKEIGDEMRKEDFKEIIASITAHKDEDEKKVVETPTSTGDVSQTEEETPAKS